MPEDLSKCFEPMLDPLLAVERSLAAQAGPPNAATHAVIPTSYGGVDEVGTRDRQASAMYSVSFLGLFSPKVHKTVSFFVSFHRGATRS